MTAINSVDKELPISDLFQWKEPLPKTLLLIRYGKYVVNDRVIKVDAGFCDSMVSHYADKNLPLAIESSARYLNRSTTEGPLPALGWVTNIKHVKREKENNGVWAFVEWTSMAIPHMDANQCWLIPIINKNGKIWQLFGTFLSPY